MRHFTQAPRHPGTQASRPDFFFSGTCSHAADVCRTDAHHIGDI